MDRLIHSLLIETSKAKGHFSDTLVKRHCENVGVETNDEVFYNLMGYVTEFMLDGVVKDIKDQADPAKGKKQSMLNTPDVRKIMEQNGIFMCTSKVIPEMGISESNQTLRQL